MSKPIVCPYCGGHIPAELMECSFCGHDLRNHNPEGSLPIGTVIGERYTLADCVSVDGEGCTYCALENESNLRVLVKEYFPVTLSLGRAENGEIETKPGSEVLFKTTRMDFEELYQTLQRITPATGLVAVLDVLQQNNTIYAVMEQAEGMTLTRYLSTRGMLMKPEEARSILQPVMEGAAALHKAGLVHRGICPENILLTDGGVARLTGYATLGLRTAGSELKEQLYEGYSAPEQYSAAEFEGRYTDVYALAAVAFRLVTGQTPVSAAQRRVKDSLERADEYGTAVPKYFSEVLEYAMRLDPAKRIQNVPELMGALSSQAAANALFGRDEWRKNEQVSTKNILAATLLIILILLLMMVWILMRLFGGSEQPAVEVPPESAVSSSTVAEPEIQLIPDFVGKSYLDIQYDNEYLGTYRFVVTEDYSSEVEKGNVMSQEPAAGTMQSESNQIIQLVISKGPNLVPMPNIIGFTMDNAVALLNERGIQFSLLMLANSGEYAAGCVARTNIAPGTELDTGNTIVNVYIAAERDNTAAPEYEESTEENPEG